jgi:hypothetical protein
MIAAMNAWGLMRVFIFASSHIKYRFGGNPY